LNVEDKEQPGDQEQNVFGLCRFSGFAGLCCFERNVGANASAGALRSLEEMEVEVEVETEVANVATPLCGEAGGNDSWLV